MRNFMLISAFAVAFMFACKEEGKPAETPPAAPAKPMPPPPPPPTAKAEPIIGEFTLMSFTGGPTIDALVKAGGKISNDLVDLGRMLYYETRLSKAHDVSCNTCHGLANYGVDGKTLSTGHRGQLGTRNSPTVYNASMQFVQFWDGRAKDVEEQALGPITNPVEMAMPVDGKRVVATLESIPEYADAFKKLFPNDAKPVSMENVGKAIGAFERRLITPAPFHKFIAGDTKALTEEEQRGLEAFHQVGCTSCHTGAGVGGTQYQKLGAVKAWPELHDKGLGDITKKAEDDYKFKVPTLLNVAKTAPYGHDGKMETLEEAVKMMAEYQLGKTVSDAEVKSIVVFLNTLTGEIPTDFIKEPSLPKSTAKTPKPDKKK
ncbi:MAG: c-type cytochrome [Cystobacterineae bacterium]|nr:c-type cytochrome [Cystobacterineae bacterium]